MNRQQDDSDLRKLFAAIRESDGDLIPSFQRVWNASRLRQPKPAGVRILRLAVFVFLVLLGVHLVNRPETKPVKQLAGSLSKWKAPTDFLLKTPGMEVLQSVPTFGAAPHSGLGSAESNQTQE